MGKVISFETGREIKGPSLKKLREDSAKVLTATGMSRQAGEESFEPVGYAADRLLKPLERRMARSLTT